MAKTRVRIDETELVKLRNEGMTLRELAAHFDVSSECIRQKLIKQSKYLMNKEQRKEADSLKEKCSKEIREDRWKETYEAIELLIMQAYHKGYKQGYEAALKH